MEIERYDGMPPFQPDAGHILFHATVYAPTPHGFCFQAKPDADESELKRLAGEQWKRIAIQKGITPHG